MFKIIKKTILINKVFHKISGEFDPSEWEEEGSLYKAQSKTDGSETVWSYHDAEGPLYIPYPDPD